MKKKTRVNLVTLVVDWDYVTSVLELVCVQYVMVSMMICRAIFVTIQVNALIAKERGNVRYAKVKVHINQA